MSQICEYDILMINYQTAQTLQEVAEIKLFKALGGVLEVDGNMWPASIGIDKKCDAPLQYPAFIHCAVKY